MRLTSLEVRVAGLAGLWILACSGCHTIYPFDSEEQDAGVELGVADAAADASADAPLMEATANDGPLSDWPLSDQPLSDQLPPDQTPPDQVVFDASPPDACWPGPQPPTASVCVDTEGAATNGCNACPPADDGDCDGLKGPSYHQDPWPWNRNVLLIADGFKDLLTSRWTASSGAIQDSALGLVTLASKASLTLKSTCCAALPNPDYLTEVKYNITSSLTNGRIFNLHTPLQGMIHRLCQVNATSSSTTLQLEVRYSTTGGTAGNSKTDSTLVLTQGTPLLLQSWSKKGTSSHEHNCRLLTGDGQKKLIHITADQPLSYTGTSQVKISGDGATYALDYVRVYKP